ncbi:MAG TPA: tetratricopeptide repeat protein, partial [Telluria sp.]|nr:tetratricopeptide repeat protein [Telluria sp.]
ALCAGTMLLACADLAGRFSVPEQGAVRNADDAYVAGRNHHLARRYEDALRAYKAALALDPGHVNARNGVATIYAERRAFAQAIPIWRGITDEVAMSSGPASAYLFSNLGYAYFLSGDYENAALTLEKACLRDPLNPRAWHHLGETLQKLGQEQRAQDMFRQAAALQQHDLRADYAAAGASAAVPAIDAALKVGERPEGEWGGTEIVTRVDGLLELKRTAPAGVPAQVQTLPVPAPGAPARPEAALPAVALLEIRNGNGVNGMAKALKLKIDDPGIKVVRLTNEKGFNVAQTRVEYQGPFRAAAEQLARRFDNAGVVEVDNCRKTDMRLVIGRDLARSRFALRSADKPAAAPVAAGGGAPDKAG